MTNIDLASKERRIVLESSIHIHNKRYVGVDDNATAVLYKLNGQVVLIAHDPLNLTDITVLDLAGQHLCKACLDEVKASRKEESDE